MPASTRFMPRRAVPRPGAARRRRNAHRGRHAVVAVLVLAPLLAVVGGVGLGSSPAEAVTGSDVRTFGGSSPDYAFDVALAADGARVVVGRFAGASSFKGASPAPVLSSAGELDGFIARYDRNGSLQWVRQIGGP